MLLFNGNEKLLEEKGIGICGSIYPSEYGIDVIKDFVDSQKQLLIFHNEKGIARVGIRQGKLKNKRIIIISRYRSYIEYEPDGNILFIWVLNSNEQLYFNVFESLVEKIAIIELSKTSRLFLLIDNLLNKNVEIYVIPGPIYSKNSSGCNLLIAEGANLLYDELEI